VLAAHGYALHYAPAWAAADIGPHIAESDLLCVLGGPIGAYDEERYPFIKDEIAIIEQRLEAGTPLMGICLGAQLIARAAGARVYPSGTKEIGLAPITLTDAGRSSCLAPFAEAPMALHWHGDTFDLPAGARLLARTAPCPNQAFALGSRVIGLQFHAEADLAAIESWLVGHAVELAGAGVDVAALRSEAARRSAELSAKGREVAEAWLEGL